MFIIHNLRKAFQSEEFPSQDPKQGESSRWCRAVLMAPGLVELLGTNPMVLPAGRWEAFLFGGRKERRKGILSRSKTNKKPTTSGFHRGFWSGEEAVLVLFGFWFLAGWEESWRSVENKLEEMWDWFPCPQLWQEGDRRCFTRENAELWENKDFPLQILRCSSFMLIFYSVATNERICLKSFYQRREESSSLGKAEQALLNRLSHGVQPSAAIIFVSISLVEISKVSIYFLNETCMLLS